jgi:hypothetical protein
MGRTCSMHKRAEDCITNLIGQPVRKRQLGRPRQKWKRNIEVGLKKIGWESANRIHLIQEDRGQFGALVKTIVELRCRLNESRRFLLISRASINI